MIVLKTRSFHTARLITALLACAALIACGGEDASSEQPDDAKGAAVAPASGDSMDIVFQLTGMVLVVPPKNTNEHTHLLLPHAQDHLAFFGIGYAPRDTALCAKQRRGICYVDLVKWHVDPLGPRDEPTDSGGVGIPRRVLNVRRAAGPNYQANVQATKGEARAHLTFLTGRARSDVCSRGIWTYKPVATGRIETDTFANVMTWVMRYRRNEPFRVRFVLKTDSQTVREIPLDTSLDSVNLAIAHVTPEDTAFLPAPIFLPAAMQKSAPARETIKLDHIHHYYSLLRHEADNSSPGNGNRPVPVLVGDAGPAICPVTVTPAGKIPKMLAPELFAGVKTYGCVVGTGGG